MNVGTIEHVNLGKVAIAIRCGKKHSDKVMSYFVMSALESTMIQPRKHIILATGLGSLVKNDRKVA